MVKITLKIEGMRCPMCEAHMNDAVNKNFKVKKVTSSHSDKETVIISEAEIDEDSLKTIVSDLGFELIDVKSETYEKKGLFSALKK